MSPGNQPMRILQWTAMLTKSKEEKWWRKFRFKRKLVEIKLKWRNAWIFVPEDKEVDDKSLKRSLKKKSKDWRSLKPKYRKGSKV